MVGAVAVADSWKGISLGKIHGEGLRGGGLKEGGFCAMAGSWRGHERGWWGAAVAPCGAFVAVGLQ